MQNKCCVLFILIICVSSVSMDFLNINGQVEKQCLHRCRLQNHTDIDNYDDSNNRCNLKCEEGCKLWKVALNSSCQGACNGTQIILSPEDLYCIIGCNDAVTHYYTELRMRLGDPPPPALVADSLTSTSLRLEWNFPEASQSGMRYFLQWRYEEHAAAWQYCRNQSWGPQDTVFVDNLQPYTKYRFRVALIMSNMTEPIVSPPSVVISTQPAGVPASPPVIVRAVPVDSTRISVSWEPGPFPHGPLLSYVLRITDNQPLGYSALKDVSAETNHMIFRNLSPLKPYTISISMSNGKGTGPAANISVSTPPETADKDIEKPVLILGAHHVVIEQGTDMLDEPVILYNTNEFITGLAIHVNKRLLFVSNSARYVQKMPLYKYTNHTKNTVILAPSQMNFIPLDLSMDWLNDHVYILGEISHQSKVWQIARCNLDGRGLTVAVAGLRIKPHHIEVDPYNGYLFWVTKIGIYRLDLADISNGIKHEVQPILILPESNIGAFTVDHIHFRLLVANQTNSTVNSVSFDGKEVSNMRPSITASRLQKVVSLAQANNIFYWTDGDEVLYEELHPTRSYYHNQFPLQLSRSYIKVLVNLTSSQPVPIPLNPPTSVQAIFGTNIAKTSWMTPHLIGGQGKGAWQNWSYEILIKNKLTNEERIIQHINSTLYTINNLKENTHYVIKTAAYTSFGRGSWSSEFVGRTLKVNKDANQPLIIWSAAEGLLKSDATGESVETVLHKSLTNPYSFNDIAWYKEQLYLVTNTSQVYWYNMNTYQYGILSEIDSVGSIAVDWIGKKLYWSNPKQQCIIRGSLNGSHQEPLPILTLAKELNIDAINAYLYWSTGYAVECAHLNGADKIIYHEAQLFSGKKVMGLTLDLDNQLVYWIVRGSDHSEGSNLFRAPMAGSVQFGSMPVAQKVTRLQNENMKGPLSYFNNRLIWLQDDKSAVISDMQGKFTASVSGKSFSGLNMMYVMDTAQHTMPNSTNGSKRIMVIPEIIDKNSIKVVGTWQHFNITWTPAKNVNYGTIFYEIKIDSLSNDSTILTTYPTLKYWKSVTPYTKLQITIRALTYWGSSPQIRVRIHTPPSTPSEPRNPRVYVIHQHHTSEEQINITFRWDSPENANGVLEGYKVLWWFFENNVAVNDSTIIDAGEKEYIVSGLKNDEKYFFQVQAFTESGDGNMSQTIQINTRRESPVPTLLIASSTSIYIQDIDTNQNFSLMQGISRPIEMAYLLKERKVFWINDMQELRLYNLANSNQSKMYDVNGKAVSLCVDWLERSLYYIQRDEMKGSVLYKLDLNFIDHGIVKNEQIFRTPFVITKIEVSPFSKKLYWIESDLNKTNYRLMQSNTDGTNITPFFSEYLHEKGTISDDNSSSICNCPIHPTVGKTFTIDHSNTEQKPLIVFIDKSTDNILATDKHGCYCSILANHSLVSTSMPISTIKSDFDTIYWINHSRNTLFSFKKHESVLKRGHLNAHEILIYGSHMQPYPELDCLTPTFNETQMVSLAQKTSHTLTLQMPELSTRPECLNISMATIEYKIYYMPYEDDENLLKCDEMCTQELTFDDQVVIKNLRPYSKYLFSVALSNYFMDFNKYEVIIGIGVVFQTAAGAPSPPRNVQAIVLNPTLVKITWSPPEELNGDIINYEIHWQTDGFVTGIRQKGEQKFMKTESADTLSYQDNLAYDTINVAMYETLVKKLSPNETYSIWVRAYSQTNETIDSDIVKIQTYPEPDNITLMESTAFKMILKWNISSFVEWYLIQYSLLTTNHWANLTYNDTEDNGTSLSIVIEDLKPKTQYKFRLCLKYREYDEFYFWPKDSRFTYETQGDRPSPPGIPLIQNIKDTIYQVRWEASKDNGATIELYNLETLKIPNYVRNKRNTNRTAWSAVAPSVEEPDFVWDSIHNGTETYWRIDGLTDEYRYAFRVSSLNAYGWSDLSEESIQFDLTVAAKLAEKQDMKYVIMAIAIPLLFVCTLIVAIRSCKFCCTTNKKNQEISYPPRGPDVELATLRELPRRGNFVHNTNVLYVASQAAGEELTLLPHIRRDQITLMKFLGSGAFGEVFEGKAKGFTGNDTHTKVAVKTLRKGASDQEKLEFLQEAQLMSHFKHEHILQLLGVCLDNDPHFIIMELMQGGDLLTYLRSSRKGATNTPSLNLLELLKMCVDVARGCRYLEEMHFVHRDLACRNCLVSSQDPESRIVKIGDFGLARDIYKNDYYRKEGEGLLPVRWMAPESLVDGVFTCQSDGWAFGVLLWEIMTLGQQPYPARNNLEVLHYVRRGGRLGKPTDCPEALHELMLTCWSYEPETRPTFKYCLDKLERLHLQTAQVPMTGAHIGQYISTVPQHMDGISNQAYFQDENHNNSGGSWKSAANEEELSREPFLQTTESQPETEIPKYLELIYDSDPCSLENDGYEVPISNNLPEHINSTADGPVKTESECDSFSKVVNELTCIENLLKDNNVDYTNMKPELQTSKKLS